jgi:hypothetical protein
MYDLRMGPQSYKFFEGIPVSVPAEVAQRCEQTRGDKGRPIFKITPDGIDPDADVAAALGVQLKFRAFGG